MSVKIPYMRKDMSTLLLLSAVVIALLLLVSPVLPRFNPLLQPAQAQTTMTFKTTQPATGTVRGDDQATLLFDAQGADYSSDSKTAKITSGTV
jgi:hypothetical protein